MHDTDWYDDYFPYANNVKFDNDSDSEFDSSSDSDNDEENDQINYMTTFEQRKILDDLHRAMKTITNTNDITEYLRSLVHSMIIVFPSTCPMDHIFAYIHNEFDRYVNDESSRREIWQSCLYDLMWNSYIRGETLDLQGRVTLWSEEKCYPDKYGGFGNRIVERGSLETFIDGTIYIR